MRELLAQRMSFGTGKKEKKEKKGRRGKRERTGEQESMLTGAYKKHRSRRTIGCPAIKVTDQADSRTTRSGSVVRHVPKLENNVKGIGLAHCPPLLTTRGGTLWSPMVVKLKSVKGTLYLRKRGQGSSFRARPQTPRVSGCGDRQRDAEPDPAWVLARPATGGGLKIKAPIKPAVRRQIVS